MRTKSKKLNNDLFEKIMVLVEKALEEAGLKKKDVHDILLVRRKYKNSQGTKALEGLV